MKYYIGDLCYVLPDGIYNDCIVSEEGRWQSKGGVCFAYGSTAYGDGAYYDNRGNEYHPVDAGIIGIVALDGSFEPLLDYEYGGNVFEFVSRPKVFALGGVFRFGHVPIDTTCDDEEEEHDDCSR